LTVEAGPLACRRGVESSNKRRRGTKKKEKGKNLRRKTNRAPKPVWERD